MSAGIILVHGFTGSPENLRPLAQHLSVLYPTNSVTNVCLAGHGEEAMPVFSKQAFLDNILSAVDTYEKENRKIILLGHSTGGILVLSFLLQYSFTPHLLVLGAVPKQIDSAYFERWNKHTSGGKELSFSSLAKMVSLINAVGSERFNRDFPVLIMHGEHDELVTLQEAYAWKHNYFSGPTRFVIIPSAGHDIFSGANNSLAIDIVERAISDVIIPAEADDKSAILKLSAVEQEVNHFLAISPFSERHLARCPGIQTLAGLKPSLQPLVSYEPVFANIEITTRCNLKCKYCARTLWGREGYDMSEETFSCLMALLPHAYRITLVGLGEPLLHPQITDLVSEAVYCGRRVSIVTNAMCLDESVSYGLLKAGLHSIAFSIDCPDQDLASAVRKGSDLKRVIENIKQFVKMASSLRPVSTAVFAAVSKETAPYLDQLINVVADLGVNVLMLSDLNFRQNLMNTVWKNIRADDSLEISVRKAVSHAFSKKLPVLSVHGLEEFGMAKRYEQFLLLPPGKLYQRSARRTWCCSPWQTVPVDVHGNVTICDCQPEDEVGNLLTQPLSDIWNSKKMVEYRSRMLSSDPPEACTICPRF
jgi:radical SAM protein with 4Fe4S-binding SPASM domain